MVFTDLRSALGNSLSYASTDGCNGAASPMILADKLLPDNKEIVIMTDKPCNGDCGTVRPGTVAYRMFPYITSTPPPL